MQTTNHRQTSYQVDTGDVLIEGRGLTKHYGAFVAVDSIDFEVVRGECFGFLGPNGAGKTTTIRMICCVSPVTGGVLEVLGMPAGVEAREIKARLGVVPQDDNLDNDLTVIENLLAYARYFDVPRDEALRRADEVLETMALTDKRHEQIDNLSGGLKRRLVVARALISRPELLILDEPTTGLDPQARQLFWQRLRHLKRQGMTMLLTTHYMEEAAQLCDRVLIMDQSRIIARGTPAELIASIIGEQVVELHLDGAHEADVASIQRLAQGYKVEETDDVVFLYDHDGRRLVDLDLDAFEPVTSEIVQRKASLEDVFLRLTGRELIE
ncbi:MAG TPA: ABC transporter ATP-binding protein [Dehalococcoidia bacterium]|nr:ABC transporter ATP-binding protein [Dehalococcoidia bacterium]